MLGLDIGGTKMAAGVVRADGVVEGFVVAPTDAARGPKDGLGRLFKLGRRAVAESAVAWEELAGIGIGSGGPLSSTSSLGPKDTSGSRSFSICRRR